DMGDLLARYTGDSFPVEATPEGQLDLDGGGVDEAVVAGRHALAVSRLAPALEAALDKQGMKRLYDEIENPLVAVLARMEETGIGVDAVELRRLHERLTSEGRAPGAEGDGVGGGGAQRDSAVRAGPGAAGAPGAQPPRRAA